jgi:hypothetical protein
VNPTRPPNTNEHPEELLLPYVEGLLPAAERAMVEEHLGACPRCASAEAELRDTVALLKGHREAFCPEPWELYEYVHYGVEPDVALKKHLDSCDACSEIVETFRVQEPAGAIPAAVLDKVRGRHPRPAESGLAETANLWDVVSRFFRRPVFGAVAAAAAVLVVFFLYPREVSQYPIAFSPVTWESTPKPKAFAPSMPRVALVLAVKECDRPFTRRSLDSLYEALAPSMELYERFQIVSPAMVRNGLGKLADAIESRARLLEGLRTQLDISLACLVTIECKGDRMNLQTDLVDTASRAVRAGRTQSNVSPTELEAAVRSATHEVLMSGRE